MLAGITPRSALPPGCLGVDPVSCTLVCTNGWSVYWCALSLVLWSTTVPEKVTAGLPLIQSICLSLGLALDHPDARDRNSRLKRAWSFMSPVRNIGVLGSAPCSCCGSLA